MRPQIRSFRECEKYRPVILERRLSVFVSWSVRVCWMNILLIGERRAYAEANCHRLVLHLPFFFFFSFGSMKRKGLVQAQSSATLGHDPQVCLLSLISYYFFYCGTVAYGNLFVMFMYWFACFLPRQRCVGKEERMKGKKLRCGIAIRW
ncbi:hypothetical protein TraAM80_08036 [Trypanosoma rangeli]|uniref:Uncharacterized protein n=1 Tax=Trypanosoma rangeli TaxID=5698 RepID=A0A3R7M5R1_TRYRA|nr:uncharacterized protein TraAM80_08036 [Trypanosoma rangeli]RNE99896.1 hypothetical protein TraAM80_08036 [Trypanosoma rangeli]|eukprot:RNE99896.1 hypothetical protein TraAM80_08036 [Trypanosoma rangeli]